MLLWLINWIADYYHGFNVINYVTLRIILSTLTSLFLVLFLGPYVIRLLTQYQIGQTVRNDGPQSHYKKAGTPTMGGVLIIASLIISTLLWGNLHHRYLWIVMCTTILFSIIGLIDDYRKIMKKNTRGLPARWKYFWQSAIALTVSWVLFSIATLADHTSLTIPFIKQGLLTLGPFYILFSYLVIVGSSNAVNLTDGLDGLAIVPIALVGGGLGVFAYVAGYSELAHYLRVPFIPGATELTIFVGAMVGSCLGFLWFNAYPAQIFMGDVGALALGATLGTLAVIIRQEFVLFIMGGIFVVETISVIFQVGSYKTRKKRIFRMAPIHHHFELKGWPEPKVVVRFWIITIVLVLIGLSSLKIR